MKVKKIPASVINDIINENLTEQESKCKYFNIQCDELYRKSEGMRTPLSYEIGTVCRAESVLTEKGFVKKGEKKISGREILQTLKTQTKGRIVEWTRSEYVNGNVCLTLFFRNDFSGNEIIWPFINDSVVYPKYIWPTKYARTSEDFLSNINVVLEVWNQWTKDSESFWFDVLKKKKLFEFSYSSVTSFLKIFCDSLGLEYVLQSDSNKLILGIKTETGMELKFKIDSDIEPGSLIEMTENVKTFIKSVDILQRSKMEFGKNLFHSETVWIKPNKESAAEE